jgi:hypothetical protein
MNDERRGRILMGNYYRITVQGHLSAGWARWFDGLVVANQSDGKAVLVGRVGDQAALHGVLAKIRDLGLPLVAVQRIDHHGARED